MDVEIALQNLYQACLTLVIAHSFDTQKEQRLRELEKQMIRIRDEFQELIK